MALGLAVRKGRRAVARQAARWLPRTAAACLVLAAGPAAAERPSFDCAGVREGSIPAMVCADDGLVRLDNKLAQVYGQAVKKTGQDRLSALRAAQRGWIKGRDDCWKAGDRRACVAESYARRIAELQALYRLVPGNGSVTYTCTGGNVTATYFKTEPPTLVARRGDATSLMFVQPSGSGARYAGRNETLWEHQGEAMIRWGDGTPELRCPIRR